LTRWPAKNQALLPVLGSVCQHVVMTLSQLSVPQVDASVDALWDAALPVLFDYIAIPAKSPAYAPNWAAEGHLADAVELIRSWCVENAPADANVVVHEIQGRTPLITIEVPAFGDPTSQDTVMLYGHLDKQPEMTGWRDGLGPWTPVLEGDRLYGRGGGDDGYSAFAIIGALNALRDAGGSHCRCVGLIEASEESGSVDLPAHLEQLGDFLGDISLVVCLDSCAADYDALWATTSLRGGVGIELRVDVLDRGMHSGLTSGAAPTSMRVLRQLLDRIEDPVTGRILLDGLHAEIPEGRIAEAHAAAATGVDVRNDIAYSGTTEAPHGSAADMLLATTWEPTLCYVGIDGVPSLAEAGNVLRPFTTLGLSFRLPPTVDCGEAAKLLIEVLSADPPSNATVTVTATKGGNGWNAPVTEPWLAEALTAASMSHFGRPAGGMGIGGGIPFMSMLGERYPDAQFLITGVLGPESNAHGPNEFLHLPTARKVTACAAHVIDAHARR
jgi:acetylornithine deacetylase/succinyl-diaminopimelate desuccinylase-like protein